MAVWSLCREARRVVFGVLLPVPGIRRHPPSVQQATNKVQACSDKLPRQPRPPSVRPRARRIRCVMMPPRLSSPAAPQTESPMEKEASEQPRCAGPGHQVTELRRPPPRGPRAAKRQRRRRSRIYSRPADLGAGPCSISVTSRHRTACNLAMNAQAWFRL